VGGFDPVTRQPMNASMTIPNAALRSATQAYLDEHPWAYAEMLDGLDS
jgi:STIP1 homology and U-box containing protein 1